MKQYTDEEVAQALATVRRSGKCNMFDTRCIIDRVRKSDSDLADYIQSLDCSRLLDCLRRSGKL